MAGVIQGLLGGGTAPAAVRRPVCTIDLGGSADQWRNAFVSLTVESGFAPFVDVATLQFAPGTDAPKAAAGDTGSIALGYEDSSAALVFTGQVQAARHTISGPKKVTAINGAGVLSRSRMNQSYEKQTAGDIVKDLANKVGVDVEIIEDGVAFPFYVVDDRQSIWRHIAELARKSGYLAYMTIENALHFAPFAAGEALQTFTYATDILALDATDNSEFVDKVRVVGEGAAGSQGADAWNWLVKDPSPVQGEGGKGTGRRLITDPSLRSTDAVRQAATGIVQAVDLARTVGRLLAAGAPTVTVGSTIEISDAPDPVLNGKCLVRWLRHTYAKRTGFTTLILFSKIDGASSGLFGALGGLL